MFFFSPYIVFHDIPLYFPYILFFLGRWFAKMLTRLISLALNLKVTSLGRTFLILTSNPNGFGLMQNEIKGNPITKDAHGNRMSQMALLWWEYSGNDYHIVREKKIFYQNPYQGRKCSFSSTQVALGHKLIIHQMVAETLSTEIKWAQASTASPG